MPDTNLELCQQFVEDAGISGTFNTVVGVTGEHKRVVNWIKRAALEVEQRYFNWNFLHNFYSFDTVASQQDYDPPLFIGLDTLLGTVVGATITGDLSGATAVVRSIESDGLYVDAVVGIFKVGEGFTGPESGMVQRMYLLNLWDTTSFKVTDEERGVDFVDWNKQKEDHTTAVEGTQYAFSVLPDKKIRFWDIPESVVTIGCSFWQASTPLVLDADIPLIPQQFRDIVVYKALMYYANYESADEIKLYAKEAFDPLWEQLKASELPGFQHSSAVSTGVDIQVQVPSAGYDY